MGCVNCQPQGVQDRKKLIADLKADMAWTIGWLACVARTKSVKLATQPRNRLLIKHYDEKIRDIECVKCLCNFIYWSNDRRFKYRTGEKSRLASSPRRFVCPNTGIMFEKPPGSMTIYDYVQFTLSDTNEMKFNIYYDSV